jgi:hypothetical protein
MKRIPSSNREAIALGLASLLVALLATGCFDDVDRAPPPELVIDPASATQGDLLAVSLTAEGVDFKACPDLAPDSLTFDTKLINVYSLEATTRNAVRAYIAVDDEAAATTYAPRLTCDSSTRLEGSFRVRERIGGAEFRVEPPTGAAGAQELVLDLVSDERIFDESTSNVIFGDGEDVVVREIVVPSSAEGVYGSVLRLVVDISPTAPLRPMEVTLTTGVGIARGSFEIIERVEPAIWVIPDEVERPTAMDDQPHQYSLDVYGTDVNFRPPAPDAGPEDEDATAVTFPRGDADADSPGIDVTRVDVVSSTELQVNIAVHDYAYPGATRLRVSTGAEVAETSLTVLLPEGDPTLQLFPPALPRGCKGCPVQAEAINFLFSSPLTVECLEEGCQVTHTPVTSPSKHLVLGVTIDADFPGNSVTLEARTASHTAREAIIVTESEGLMLNPEDDAALKQGATSVGVRLSISGGTFDETAEASVLPRSGLRISSQDINFNQTVLNLIVDVAPDAPTGPTLIRVDTGGELLEARLSVEPSGATPAIDLAPSWFALGRRTEVVEVHASGFELDDKTVAYVDDPAIEVVGLALDEDDPHRAEIELELSPLARTDMSVIYVSRGTDRAAGSVNVLETERMTIAAVTPQVATRGEETVLAISADGIDFSGAVAQAGDGIGRWSRSLEPDRWDSSRAQLVVALDAAGAVGWTGIVVTSGWQGIVAPLRIVGDGHDTLTMDVSPETVAAGTRRSVVTVFLPDEAALTASSQVHADHPGVHATALSLAGTNKGLFSLDVAVDATDPGMGVPIFVTASKGAAVGFVKLGALTSHDVDEQATWQGPLGTGRNDLFVIDPGPAPAALEYGAGRPDRAAVNLSLICENGLDPDEQATGRPLWIVRGEERLALASAAANPQGDPAEIGVRSLGRHADELVEAGEASGDPVPVEIGTSVDPCLTPFLGWGTIDGAFDVDRVALPTTSCRLVADVVARRMADRPWVTPNAWVELRDLDDALIGQPRNLGWPSAEQEDPRIYFDAGAPGGLVAIGAETGSAGIYLVNVRRPYTIRELARAPFLSYVEIEAEPGADLDSLVLKLFDVEYGMEIASLDFAGLDLTSDGTILIAGALHEEVDLVHPVGILPESGPFALTLSAGGQVLDAVQVGTGAFSYGEGDPLPDDESVPVFTRLLGVDTDDNANDFSGGWVGTPGS